MLYKALNKINNTKAVVWYTLSHLRLDSVVARYRPLWVMPSRFCFWELTRELLSGSPILGMLSPGLA